MQMLLSLLRTEKLITKNQRDTEIRKTNTQKDENLVLQIQ